MVFEENPFSFQESEIEKKSFQRRKEDGNYVDANNNSTDFETDYPTPTNLKDETKIITPPGSVKNFQVASSTNNIVTLTWSTTTDEDTPDEEISYIFYWSKDGEITTSSLVSTTTARATTTATSTTLQNLDYDSIYYFGIRAFDGLNYSGLTTTTPHNIPLLPITDLNAGPSAIREAIDLFWTAPGDGRGSGQAKAYEIRYSTEEITEDNWENTTTILNSLIPREYGNIEYFLVENLTPNQPYYFAIKSINNAEATSAISNSPRAKAIPGFEDNANGTITDSYTGLMWVKGGNGLGVNNGQPLCWNKAINFCNNLVLCQDGTFTTTTFGTTTCSEHDGVRYHDWRLPNYKELVSIVNYGATSTLLINQNYFLGTKADEYWSSSAIKRSHKIFYVNFSTGQGERFYHYDFDTPPYLYIRPVRGPIFPDTLPITGIPQSWISGDDGDLQKGCNLNPISYGQTILDQCTNLMWATSTLGEGCNKGQPLKWEEAIRYAANLDLAGYQDWRLPNIQELMTIADIGNPETGEECSLLWLGPCRHNYWASTIINLGENNEDKYYLSLDFGMGGYVGDTGAINRLSIAQAEVWQSKLYVRVVRDDF